MFREYLITLLVAVLFLPTPLVLAGEMERYSVNCWIDSHFPKGYMEPILPLTTPLEDKLSDSIYKEVQRSFINSIPDPSDIYALKKMEHDVLKVANTMVYVGSAAIGDPLSKVGAVNNIIHNFGPQHGGVQKTTGYIGDGMTAIATWKTIRDFANKDFTNAGKGVVGILNSAFGKIIDAQKKGLMEPITTSDSKYYRFKINDDFLRIEKSGIISTTKTYIPPKTIKPFGPPDIFDGTTVRTTQSHSVTRVQTGRINNNFNNNLSMFNSNFKVSRIGSYNIPKFNYNIPKFTYRP